MLTRANSDILPNMYQRQTDDTVSKFLIRPISGAYSPDFLNPLTTDSYFTPLLTNGSGMVTFQSLAFSVAGPAGTYRIAYICDGVMVESGHNVAVIIETFFVFDQMKYLKLGYNLRRYSESSKAASIQDFG